MELLNATSSHVSRVRMDEIVYTSKWMHVPVLRFCFTRLGLIPIDLPS
jgi:hypothetical protein